MPGLREIWGYQAGYRSDALSGDEIVDWDKDLLVFADQGADAIAVSRRDGKVLSALHGQGRWRFTELADSVADLVVAIAVLGSVIEQVGSMGLTLDNSAVDPQHVHDAERILTPLSVRPSRPRYSAVRNGPAPSCRSA